MEIRLKPSLDAYIFRFKARNWLKGAIINSHIAKFVNYLNFREVSQMPEITIETAFVYVCICLELK